MSSYKRDDGVDMVDFLPNQAVSRRIGERLGLLTGASAAEAATVSKTGSVGKTEILSAPSFIRVPVVPTVLPARVIKTVRSLAILNMAVPEIVRSTGFDPDVVDRVLAAAL